MRTLLTAVGFVVMSAVLGAQQQAPAWTPPPPTPEAIRPQDAAYKSDMVEFTLAPDEGMEYKYRLGTGAGFVYTWTASGPLHFEMHSVPDGAPSEFAETFEKLDDRPAGHGSYVAPFTGIHGWYWKNNTASPVTLKFSAAGFFTQAQEFRRGQKPQMKEF